MRTNGHVPTADPVQEAQTARVAIGNLLDGNPPNGLDPAMMGVYGEVYRELHIAYSQGGTEAARAAFAAYVNADPALAVLRAGDDDDEPQEPSPLDAQPQHDIKLGWVDDYAELMSRLTGSPAEFNRLTGLVLAATVIQRRARLRMSFADIYPNIYATILAPSSVYHKSSALGKVRQVIERAGLDKLLLSELMTSEGLLGQLQGKPSGVVIRDEIGTLFDSHQTKYLRNLKPDLTALYDCFPYSRRLSAIEIKVERPYLNIIGATTPDRFFDGVAAIDWRDGFLARWLFVLPEAEPNWDAMAGLYTTEHDAQVGAIATPLVNLDRQHDTDFVLVGDAFALWDAWQRQAAKEAFYYGDDTTAAIVRLRAQVRADSGGRQRELGTHRHGDHADGHRPGHVLQGHRRALAPDAKDARRERGEAAKGVPDHQGRRAGGRQPQAAVAGKPPAQGRIGPGPGETHRSRRGDG